MQPSYPPSNPDYQTRSYPPALPPVEPDQPRFSRSDGRDSFKNIASTILILLAAPLIALALTAFVFQSYEVDGPSMETTLQNQDRLIVLKAERTWARLTGKTYIPERGDIIVFSKDGSVEFGESREKQLIKRVIGLPGERVVVHGGIMTVYNAQNPNGFVPDETLPYGNVITTTSGNVDLTVPPGEVFVAGDNRGNSLDSRAFGTVESGDIVGTLYLRILPVSTARKF